MEPRPYKILELVGISEVSYDDAARRAIQRAARTLTGLGWYKVTATRKSRRRIDAQCRQHFDPVDRDAQRVGGDVRQRRPDRREVAA